MVGQLKYLVQSMHPGQGEWFSNPKVKGYYLSYSNFITSNASVEYLTQVFLWSYERPAVAGTNQRIAYAEYWYRYFS